MNDIIKKLIEKYGDKQMIVAIEELSELQKELCKALRGNANIDNITEELADAYIMLDQIQVFYDIPINKIVEIINFKLERTKERLFN